MPEETPRHPYFRDFATWVMPRLILIVDQDAALVRKLEVALQETGVPIVTGTAVQRPCAWCG